MLGGIPEGSRELLTDGEYGAFEQLVERVFGERLRASEPDAKAFWGALANIEWKGPDDSEVAYSFRAAGDLMAAIRSDEGTMTYMNYYCAAPDGVVPEWVAEPMAREGWRGDPYGDATTEQEAKP
jgi:hypothetical protein